MTKNNQTSNPDPYAYLNNVDLVKLYNDLPSGHLKNIVAIKLSVKQQILATQTRGR